jgi:glycosyltransferase involved in cell wall biosynthesis
MARGEDRLIMCPSDAAARPEVTIVVIFRDAEDFLEEAIESVRDQTFRAWELLLVDDGSSDRSTAMARRYAADEARSIRYLDHPRHAHLGMSATRNLGVSHARGELVGFLDADDVLVPAAIDEQVTLLRTHPRVGMVYGPLEYWYGWTGEPRDIARDFVHPLGVPADRVYQPPSLIARFVANTGFAPAGMLFRKKLFERVGGFEEAFRDLYEDQVFAAKICLAAPVYVSGRRWYRYRQHPNACCQTAQRDGRMDAAREPFLHWLLEHLQREGYEGSEAWRAARAELAAWRTIGRRLSRRLGRFEVARRLQEARLGFGTRSGAGP